MANQKNCSIIKRDNEDCLYIHTSLLEAFQKCEENSHHYLNLVGIFFSDLMKVLTGYALLRNELYSPYTPSKDQLAVRQSIFPFIDYQDIINGIDIEKKIFILNHLIRSRKKRIFSYLSGLISFTGRNGRRIIIGKKLSADFKKLYLDFFKSRYRVDFPAPEQIHIPDYNIQLKVIEHTIEKIFKGLDLPGDSEIMSDLLERHVQIYCSSRKTETFDNSLLVSGPLDINERILATKSLGNNIPVISVFHGEGDGVVDEPIYGYAERAYSSIFIGYGDGAKIASENCYYGKTLYEPAKYITANSNLIRSLYKSDYVEPLGDIDNNRIFYVPTAYVFNRYGPFRDMSEQLYQAWQDALAREFPNIIFKVHPKIHLGSLSTPKVIKTVTKRLEDILDEIDIFVFDYISTAFFIAAATSKPIIYFNIGLRNFSEIGLKKTKKRCIWVDVDPINAKNLREKVETLKCKECVNEFTEVFSLSSENGVLSREDTILKTIKEIFEFKST